MPAQSLRRGLWALALAAFAACSFPSVEYADAADADTASGCIVTGNCAEDANKCGGDAAREHISCGQKCFGKPDPTCQNACDTTFDAKVSQCTALCESCAQQQQGCSDAAASCQGLVGGP